MGLIVSFPGTGQAILSEVGGKGYSLIRMAEAGLPVLPGAVLTTEFFAPWIDAIRASSTWSFLAGTNPDAWSTLCDELKQLCSGLTLLSNQRETLEELREQFAMLGEGMLFAMRSSSPEEDLASATFAGVYETKLGVRGHEVEQALRHCFASAFDERVFLYKRSTGSTCCRLAVVVQLSHELGILDALIAETAVGLNMELTTFNTKHYSIVATLQTIQPYARE